MEGNEVYKTSYTAVEKAIKSNFTGTVTIDYSKFDERTAFAVRSALSKVLQERKKELWAVISGVN